MIAGHGVASITTLGVIRNVVRFVVGSCLSATVMCCMAGLCRVDGVQNQRNKARMRFAPRIAVFYGGSDGLLSAGRINTRVQLKPVRRAVLLGYSDG